MTTMKAKIEKIMTESYDKPNNYPIVKKRNGLTIKETHSKKKTFDIDISVQGIKNRIKSKEKTAHPLKYSERSLFKSIDNKVNNIDCRLFSMASSPNKEIKVNKRANYCNIRKPNLYKQFMEFINNDQGITPLKGKNNDGSKQANKYNTSNSSVNQHYTSSSGSLLTKSSLLHHKSFSLLNQPRNSSFNGFNNTLTASSTNLNQQNKDSAKSILGKFSTVNIFKEKKDLSDFSRSFDFAQSPHNTKTRQFKSPTINEKSRERVKVMFFGI